MFQKIIHRVYVGFKSKVYTNTLLCFQYLHELHEFTLSIQNLEVLVSTPSDLKSYIIKA